MVSAILEWMSSSQLFSTLLMLIFGSILLYKWQSSRAFQYDAIKLISEDISKYSEVAIKYWQLAEEGKDEGRRLYALRLKMELECLYQLVEEISVINNELKPELHKSLGFLFNAATGGAFETDGEKKEAEAHIHDVIAYSSVAKRQLLLSGCKK